nr:MAG TPA: hypothetical protein [Caudoviricetes sp.]
MRLDLRGCTRSVILFRGYAIKIPTFKSWKLFLKGILANLQERHFSEMKDPNLCPVVFSDKFGFLVIMKRCKVVKHRGLWMAELHTLKGSLPKEFYLSDLKPENYGYLGGRLVKLDYGD